MVPGRRSTLKILAEGIWPGGLKKVRRGTNDKMPCYPEPATELTERQRGKGKCIQSGERRGTPGRGGKLAENTFKKENWVKLLSEFDDTMG